MCWQARSATCPRMLLSMSAESILGTSWRLGACQCYGQPMFGRSPHGFGPSPWYSDICGGEWQLSTCMYYLPSAELICVVGWGRGHVPSSHSYIHASASALWPQLSFQRSRDRSSAYNGAGHRVWGLGATTHASHWEGLRRSEPLGSGVAAQQCRHMRSRRAAVRL